MGMSQSQQPGQPTPVAKPSGPKGASTQPQNPTDFTANPQQNVALPAIAGRSGAIPAWGTNGAWSTTDFTANLQQNMAPAGIAGWSDAIPASGANGATSTTDYSSLSPSTQAFMHAPGSAGEQYANQAEAASNAKFAQSGITDPWGYALNFNPNPAATQPASAPAYAPAAGAGGAPAVGMPSTAPSLAPAQNSGFNAPAAPAANLAGTQFNPGQLGTFNSQLSGGNGDQIARAINDAQNSAYQNATGYLDPQFANAENSLKAQLANQGIPQNSEAWNKAMDDFGRQKQFAYQQAQSNAFGQGLSAQNQIAQQLLQALGYQTSQNVAGIGAGAQLGTAAMQANTSANQLAEQHQQNLFNNSMGIRNQDINELLLQQQNPLQMYNALTTGTSPTSPNFTTTPSSNISPTDIASIYNQAMQQNNNIYNAQVGAQNSQTAGLYGLGSAGLYALALSDRRLKVGPVKIGMHRAGVPLYTFRYLWGEPGVGVMADELERVRPDAVVTLPSGYKAVDYGRI